MALASELRIPAPGGELLLCNSLAESGLHNFVQYLLGWDVATEP